MFGAGADIQKNDKVTVVDADGVELFVDLAVTTVTARRLGDRTRDMIEAELTSHK